MHKLTKRKIVYIIAVVYAVFQLFFNRNQLPKILLFPTITPTSIPTSYIPPVKTQAVVKRVVDGDTIELTTGEKVRYIGINTPELHDPKKPVECFGQAASDENKRLVEGKTIMMEKDVSEVDKYKRLLRYVYVDNLFINDYLVRQGFAQVSTFPPDIKYIPQFLEAQKVARDNNRGLWSRCQNKN